MKVMQINCVHNTGSTGKIANDIHTVLTQKGYESVICYGRGSKINKPNIYKTSSEILAKFNNVKSRFTGMPYGGAFFATNKLLRIIKKERPDVVHLHCINGFFVNIYRLIKYLKVKNYPTVITHHAEFLYTANCAHAYECNKWQTGCGNCPSARKSVNSYFFDFTKHNFKKMANAFKGFENLYSIGVSPWVTQRAEKAQIFESAKHLTVTNGLDTKTFKYHNNNSLKSTLGIDVDKKVLLHVTANFTSESKGCKYIIELAKKLGNDYLIIVIGNKNIPKNIPPNLIAVGRIENQTELAKYYSMADLSVITGKRETFSMPVAESLCCGTPVIGFKAGGPETIAIKKYSEFAEHGEIETLVNLTKKWIDKKSEISALEIEKYAKEIYSKERMANEYIKIYKEVSEHGQIQLQRN